MVDKRKVVIRAVERKERERDRQKEYKKVLSLPPFTLRRTHARKLRIRLVPKPLLFVLNIRLYYEGGRGAKKGQG